MVKKRYFMLTVITALLVAFAAFSAVTAVESTRVDAATTAEFTVTATGEYIAISDNVTSYAFGTVAGSSTTNMSTEWVGITNPSTVQTDQTIAVTGDWTSAGTGWTHDNTGTPGSNTAAMNAQNATVSGAVWGTGVVVVETLAGSPNFIYENCPATTNYDYGVSLLAPTDFDDGEENSNTVRVTAAAG